MSERDLRDGIVELYARYQSRSDLRATGLPVPSAEDDLRDLLAGLDELRKHGRPPESASDRAESEVSR